MEAVTQKDVSSTGHLRVIAGRFELRHVLGNGGMATVYHAWDRDRRAACAVKLPAENLASDEEFRRRFRQEAEAAGALAHARIVRAYAHGVDGSTPYMAMEYVEGGTLRDLLRRRGRLPEPLALRLAAEIAEALAYAHERGVIHRDIKPHNILLTGDQHVKVADFGIARTLGETSHTKTGSVLGSMQYISPEQARGDHAGPASDQYSLGVVLYEALAGRLPFDEAETPVAMALKHINEPPFDLQWLRPGLSEATVGAVRRLLAKAPQDRYPTAAALAVALRRIYVRFGREDGADAATARVSLPAGNLGETSRNSATALFNVDPDSRRGAARARRVSMENAVAPALARATAVGSNQGLLRRRSSRWSDTGRMPAWSSPSSPRRRGTGARVALVVIGLLGLWMVAGAVYQASRTVPGSPVSRPAPSQPTGRPQVPSLLGQTVAAAQRAAASARLNVAVSSSRQDANAAAGTILAQDPPADAGVAQGTTIHVVVSQGSGIVPDLRGMSLDEARHRLADAGLTVGGTNQAFDDAVAPGMIVSESPGPPTQLAPNSPVDLVVSQGQNTAAAPSATSSQAPSPSGVPAAAAGPASGPATAAAGAAAAAPPGPAAASSAAVVPNVTGVPVGQAQAALRAARLRVGQVNYAHNLDAAPGVVIYQARVAGTEITPNDPVDLLVSEGPPTNQTSP
jgi:eukaryotic-like serine/threonine-protein kinase